MTAVRSVDTHVCCLKNRTQAAHMRSLAAWAHQAASGARQSSREHGAQQQPSARVGSEAASCCRKRSKHTHQSMELSSPGASTAHCASPSACGRQRMGAAHSPTAGLQRGGRHGLVHAPQPSHRQRGSAALQPSPQVDPWRTVPISSMQPAPGNIAMGAVQPANRLVLKTATKLQPASLLARQSSQPCS